MTEPARLQKKSTEKRKPAEKTGGIGETGKILVQALIFALIFRTVLFQAFSIPSGSMIPTLEIGDYLFVSKYSYGYSNHSLPFSPNLFSGRILGAQPKRGDVVVFKLPRDGQTDYIKRVIGLPGDKVQVTHGRLFLNGELVPREPITKARIEDSDIRQSEVPTYLETLPGGVNHRIIERDGDTAFSDNTQLFEVPSGHYFMMGDNRDNSSDSRFPAESGGVGFVPFENLVGRAEVIFFSVGDGAPVWAFWQWPWTLRWSRLFQPVR